MENRYTADDPDILRKHIRYLWALFWLMILINPVSLIEEAVQVPDLSWLAKLVDFVSTMIYGFLLLKLEPESDCYETAGRCRLAAALLLGACDLLSVWIGSWVTFLFLPAAILSVISEYQEYQGHSEILFYADPTLSHRWSQLGRWYIRIFPAILAVYLIALLLPTLGSLAILALSAAMLILAVLEPVYLFLTARRLGRYADECTEE